MPLPPVFNHDSEVLPKPKFISLLAKGLHNTQHSTQML